MVRAGHDAVADRRWWQLKSYLGRVAVTGKKRWTYRTFRRGDVQRALAALVAEAERRSLARTKATVGELLEEWIAHASPGFSPKGRGRRGGLDRNMVPFSGEVPLSELGAGDLDRSTTGSGRRTAEPAAR